VEISGNGDFPTPKLWRGVSSCALRSTMLLGSTKQEPEDLPRKVFRYSSTKSCSPAQPSPVLVLVLAFWRFPGETIQLQ